MNLHEKIHLHGMSGQQLKQARKILGMTQAKLGYMLGYERLTIIRWEKEQKIPVAAGLAVASLMHIFCPNSDFWTTFGSNVSK